MKKSRKESLFKVTWKKTQQPLLNSDTLKES